MAMPSADTDELAKFGYRQELDRSLGLFSSFAAGFSYISIMTGVFELFFFGFGTGGPAFIWTWPAVFAGQFLVALCFAELAGQYPLAGSVYQWSKQIARPFTSWFGGWILSVGAVVTLAAVAVAYQVVGPQISAAFAIIGALAAAGIAGLLVILFGEMSVPNIHAAQLGTSGLPYLVKATLGGTIGNLFLIDSLIAITVCSLAVHAGGIRMIFTMGRDGRLPFASAIARVHGKSKTPLVPSIVIGVLTLLLLVLNVGNQRAFFVLTSVAIIMFYIAYMCVTGPLLIARLRGKWPTPEHGPYFSLGRWGLPVNVLAVIFQTIVMINLAWPRAQVYGNDQWYYQWGAFVFVGLLGGVGALYYLVALRGRPASVLAEHRAGAAPAGVAAGGEEA